MVAIHFSATTTAAAAVRAKTPTAISQLIYENSIKTLLNAFTNKLFSILRTHPLKTQIKSLCFSHQTASGEVTYEVPPVPKKSILKNRSVLIQSTHHWHPQDLFNSFAFNSQHKKKRTYK